MKLTVRAVFAIVLFCFFVSGVAGLVYQVAWARYLSLFLGHTSYAVVAVLVAFMGGLALGNAWFGVRADRSRQPLAVYGWLELAIGVYAILFPTYYEICHEIFVQLARETQPGSNALLALKFLFSLATILFPTFLMGATFPVLTRFVTRALSELREKVAALYALNSAGAVAGALIADFWWIPSWGLDTTIFGGAALNILAGVAALWLSYRIREASLVDEVVAPVASASDETFTPGELRLALIGIAVSGFVAMLYEVAWTRYLGLVLGSSTHAFSLMLVTFITGIAVGAWIVYRWKGLKRTLDAFAWAELALAGSLFVTMFFYDVIPYWFLRLSALLARREEAYPVYEAIQALICFAVMFGPAVCLGMTLPLVSRVATVELARTGRSVGRVFALNTVGTVLGAVATGLWLMPSLGLARTFALGIALNALIGLAVLARHQLTLPRLIGAPALAVVFVWFCGLLFDANWKRTFTLGLWRNSEPPPTLAAFRSAARGENLQYHKDGASATVAIVRYEEPGKEHIGLKVNGKADASTGVDVSTQRLAGHIPMLLNPDARRGLVVGLGSGMSCAALLRHPTMEEVDAVEISPEVAEAAAYFAKYNDDVLSNPRLRLLIEDAKSFLKITQEKYDIIISEPSNPWMAGVSGVFTREYYESCLERLQPSGLMAQWVQLYETSDATLNMVLATFGSVFPFMSIWQTASGDLLLVGAPEPYDVDLERLIETFEIPAVKEDFERTEISTVPVLLAREIVSQQNGLFVPPIETRLHSDYYPALEFLAQKAFFIRRMTDRWRQFDETSSTRPNTLLGEYLRTHPLTESDYKGLGRFYLEHRLPSPDLFRSLLIRWQAEDPESTLPLEMMSQASEMTLSAELEALRLAPMEDYLMRHAEEDPEPLRLYASYVMQMYRAHRSTFYLPPSDRLERLLERLIETNPANQRVYRLHLSELAWDRGDDRRFLEYAQAAFDPDIDKGGRINFSNDPRAPRVALARMIDGFWRAGRLSEAWNLCQEAKKNNYTGRDTILDMVIRKVESYSSQSAAVASVQ